MNQTPYWNLRASRYDVEHVAVEPSAFYADRLITDVARTATSRPLRVLDLGGGTGRLAAQVLQSREDATVHLVDFSSEMIRLARRRLERFEKRVSFDHRSIQEAQLSSESFDLVVAARSVHHLRRDERVSLYRRIARSLRAGRRVLIFEHATDHLSQSEAQQDRERRRALLERALADGRVRQPDYDRAKRVILTAPDWERDATGSDKFTLAGTLKDLSSAGLNPVLRFRDLGDVIVEASKSAPG